MAMKFTIGRRIGLGFATLIILTTVAFILTVATLNDSKQRTETVVGQVTPSVVELKELNLFEHFQNNLTFYRYTLKFTSLMEYFTYFIFID